MKLSQLTKNKTTTDPVARLLLGSKLINHKYICTDTFIVTLFLMNIVKSRCGNSLYTHHQTSELKKNVVHVQSKIYSTIKK